MAVMISMLRGVNVGGHNKIKMDALRALYDSLGLRDARTYVQSGNVIFRVAKLDVVSLTRRIQDAIERRFGFSADVILRTAAQVRDTIAGNPFARRSGIDPSKLLVVFLATKPTPKATNNILQNKATPEEILINGRELYIYFPKGMGRTKLSWMALVKSLETTGTGRNWNSVMKLLEIAESLEASE
jgi:uncharacterized protein (DUF1697 family)